MKYMSFNSSCSYCCIANVLEKFGLSKDDKDIAVEMGLPYLFYYDDKSDIFSTGAMIQSAYYFNLYLNSIGFCLNEQILNKEDVIQYIEKNISCIIGLKLAEFGKHACVYEGLKNNKYVFLNPHRKDDTLEDYFAFSKEELLCLLSDINYISVINHTNEIKYINKNEYDKSLQELDLYKTKMLEFCNKEKTSLEIKEIRDKLFRPFAIDLLEMMKIMNVDDMVNKLKEFQLSILQLLKQDDKIVPSSLVDLKLFEEILKNYKSFIMEYISRNEF